MHGGKMMGAGEMTCGLRSPAALAEDLASVPGIHMAIHNLLQYQLQGIQNFLLASAGTKHIHRDVYIK